MLQLILGTAGTGKTTLLHERIQTCVEGGGKAILLVPEQYSFESEKALCRRLGARGALSVEVLSFTRLCDRIFREYGGIAGIHMDETAKYLLMSVALGELEGALTTYQRSASKSDFVTAMCETVSELKTAGASPDVLRGVASETGDTVFADKLRDIALIFEAYQAVIERGYSDPDDRLSRACRLLDENGGRFFESYSVFIDGFMTFMGAEWTLLSRILEHSPHVYAALTCESLGDKSRTGVFTAVTKTANRLVEAAKQNGGRVAPPITLTEIKRFRNPALAVLSEEFPHVCSAVCETPSDGVELVRCADFYDELEYIAAQISGLVRDEGYRYREIAVIGRTLDRYLVPLQTVFGQYEIPFFTDLRTDIQLHPLISGLLCALDAANQNFDTDQMLALSKKCISGVGPLEAGLLENYCFTWDISGAAWTAPFVNNPDGMTDRITPEQGALLESINAVRERIAAPVMRLRAALRSGGDGRGFAAAAFRWLEECEAVQNLQNSADEMEETEAKQFLETGAQIWDILIGLLDVFGGALADVNLPSVRMTDLLRMSAASADVGSLPQTLDQVIVGAADRIRPNEPRAVFVIGLNEGEFPLWPTASGVFSASERDRLGAQGVDLFRTPESFSLFEKYFVYFALTQASERLWLTCPQKTTAGNGLTPSPVLSSVEEILALTVQDTAMSNPAERVVNRQTALEASARCWFGRDQQNIAVKNTLAKLMPVSFAGLSAAAEGKAFQLENEGTARALFGEQMYISPSRAERYYSCPFSYFCQAGLRLGRRQKAEFNPIESGSLIHLVLEKMVRKYGGKGLSALSDEQMRAEISEIIEADLTARIEDFEGMPARFKYLFRRLVGTLCRLLRRLAVEFMQSAFEPLAFELPIGEDEETKPLDLCAPDGTRVIVEGVVDRVDVLRKNDTVYIRVVDYKSGRKSFSLADVYYGLNMQMLIYLFTICENAEERFPAGVLYMPARDSIISAERGEPEQTVREEQAKRLRMNGLLLEDREVLSAMEPDLAGIYIPVKTKKDGSYSAASSLATLEQMGAVKRQVEKLLVEIAQSLHGGKIAALPVDGLAGYAPCAWCDYHAVCGHEDADEVRRLADMDRSEVLRLLSEEEENG